MSASQEKRTTNLKNRSNNGYPVPKDDAAADGAGTSGGPAKRQKTSGKGGKGGGGKGGKGAGFEGKKGEFLNKT